MNRQSYALVLYFFFFIIGCYVKHAASVLSTRDIQWDNSFDIYEETINKAVKERFVRALGGKKASSSKSVSKLSPPKYMWDLYNSIADIDTGRIKGDSNNFIINRHNKNFYCDLIQGIYSIKKGNSWSRGIGRFHFDLSEITSKDTSNHEIVDTEFVLTRNIISDSKAGSKSSLHAFYWLEIQQVLPNVKSPQLITKQLLYTYDNRAQVTFDLLKTVRHWIGKNNSMSYLNLQLVIKTSNQQRVTSNTVGRTLFKTRFKGNSRPLLVIYGNKIDRDGYQSPTEQPNIVVTQDSLLTQPASTVITENIMSNHSNVTTDETIQDEHTRQKRSTNTKSKRNQLKKRKKKSCRRYSYEIKFSELFEDDHIVAPKKFNSNYCLGKCSFPLTRAYNATNHAIVMAILNDVNKIDHSPQCVPVKLSPISLLYTEGHKIVIRDYPDMVVEACGCH